MNWTRLAATSEVAEGEVVGVEAQGRQVALYCHDGNYFATSNVCTHQFALLSDGYFEDGCIECPLHQGRFDIRTGQAMCAPLTEDIKVFAVKVEGDDLLVDLG
jgi:3-phenylpropionate/trans-cinnamate dioxygenase ferredoxin subunit